MSVDNFKPELWSDLLVAILQEKRDLRFLATREYEGDINRRGDVVHINKFSGITVRDLAAAGTGDITIDTIASTQVDLPIDQERYFAMEVADVDAIQANISLDSPIIRDAAEKIALTQNQHLLSLLGAATSNTPISAGATVDLNDFRDARVALNSQDVPQDGRWAVIHPEVEGDLLGNANIINADQYGSRVALMEGEIGMLMGFRIVVSTSVSQSGATPDTYQNPFFHESALAWAQQKELTIESARREKGFADLLKGFVLYGGVLVQEDAVQVVERNV